jgi:hypothetical protein
MKRLMLMVLLGICYAGVFSQDSSKKPKADTSLTVSQMKNYVVMNGGKILLIKNDTSTALTSPMILPNGTSIRTDGSFLVDGHQMMLNEGDRIYLNGKIVRRTKMEASKKDSTR